MPKKIILLMFGIFIGGTIGTGYFLMRQLEGNPIVNGKALSEHRPLGKFKLKDQFEKPFTLENLKGKWSMVSFGFTHCPDICPTAMASYRDELKLLEEQKDKVQFIFVTVDPERDTAPVLKDYLEYFHKDIIGLTGDTTEITKLSKMFSSYFQKQGEGDNYSMAHSPQFFLVNPKGEWVAMYSPPLTRGKIAIDMSRVVSSRFF